MRAPASLRPGVDDDATVPQTLENLAQPHIDSFDYFLGDGLQHVIENMDDIEVSAFWTVPICSISICVAAWHNIYVVIYML